MPNTYRLKVDLKLKKTGTIPLFVQYDDARLEFKLYDNGKIFDLTGYGSVEFTHKKPNGQTVISDGSIEIDEKGDKVVAYDYYGSEMSETGFVEVSFALFNELNNKISIQPFKVNIVNDLRDFAYDLAKPEFGKIQDYVTELETYKVEIQTKIDESSTATTEANSVIEEGNQLNADVSALKTATETVRDETLTVKTETIAVKDSTQIVKEETIAVKDSTQDVQDATESVRASTDIVRLDTVTAKEAAVAATQAATTATTNAQANADQWKYTSDYNVSTAYKKNNTITFNGEGYIAKKDVTGVAPTGLLTDPNWGLVAKKGADGTGTVVRHKDTFIATANQTVFTLSKAYDQFQNRIDVTVGNVPQFSPTNFIESSANTIQFTEGLPVGVEVIVSYFSEAQPLKTDLETVVNSHTTTLNDNNNVITQHTGQITSVTEQLADKAAKSEVQSLVTNKAEVSTVNALTTEVASKASKVEVDSKLAQIGDAKPSGVYATLSALQTAFPTGSGKNIYLVSADGKWYFWNDTAWTAGGVYQSTEIPDLGLTTEKYGTDTINTNKVDFVEKSSNLFNKETAVAGQNIDALGNLYDASNYSMSGFIEVKPSDPYYFYGFLNFSMYDKNKKFLRRRDLLPAGLAFTMNNDTYYIRVAYQHTSSLSDHQVNVGTTRLTFQRFFNRLSPTVRARNYVDKSIKKHHVDDKQVSIIKTNFIKSSSNVFNSDTVKERENILATGETVRSDNYAVTDFIEIRPDETIIFNGFVYISQYNENKEFVRRSDVTNVAEFSFTAPQGVFFVKLAYQQMGNFPERRVNRGSVLLPYEEFYTAFEDDLKLDRLNEVLLKKDAIIFDAPIDGVFSTNEIYADYTGFNRTTSAETYAMFDELVAQYPQYIKKEQSVNDSTGKPISLYTAKPIKPVADVSIKTPKVFINCGLHGYEHMNTLTTYLMLKQMCEKWDEYPLLEALRYNVEFYIIPVSNPSGWDTYSRHNVNDIDLNRDFGAGWFNNPPTTGTEPFSQIESQFIKSIVDANKDFDIAIDFHNFHEGSNANNFLWIPAPNAYSQNIGRTLVSQLSRKWQSDFEFFPSDFMAGYTSTGASGTLSAYTRSLGIKHSYTFEVCNRWVLDSGGTVNDQNVCKAAVEGLVNFLLINLRELAKP